MRARHRYNRAMALAIDNAFTRELPGDPERDAARARASRPVPGALYSWVSPEPAPAPTLVAWIPEVAELLGLPRALDEHEREHWTALLAGRRALEGSAPWATRYGGHQFGVWAGQLGDGRALSLAELVTAAHGRQELQIKGAGRTPYSRHADGRAVLRSSLRELVASEALHHLGVPSSRALALVLTGEEVMRDVLYDGHPAAEPGAVVCRVAPSFVRFGHLELPAASGELELLRALLRHALTHHFPGLAADPSDPEAVLALFAEVSRRTIALACHWQRVGFVHGVLNTDNMSLLGLTIDYGPFGFLEPVELQWTPNTTDAQHRRYCYANQPRVALWNLARLAEALAVVLVPALGEKDAVRVLEAQLERNASAIEELLVASFAGKLGLSPARASTHAAFIERSLALLERVRADFTLFFRALTRLAALADDETGGDAVSQLAPTLYGASAEADAALRAWLAELRAAWRDDGRVARERAEAMRAQNPAFVPRNWVLQEAIDALQAGEARVLHELLDACRAPYEEPAPGSPAARLASKRPAWAEERVGCAMLSCSS